MSLFMAPRLYLAGNMEAGTVFYSLAVRIRFHFLCEFLGCQPHYDATLSASGRKKKGEKAHSQEFLSTLFKV